MPWTIDDVEGFNKGLTDKQKEQWVSVANSAYKSCIADGGDDEECAASAIKQANGSVKNNRFEPPESGDAPKAVKDILKAAYNSCRLEWTKDHPDDKENANNKTSCSKQAWAAVKNAGWEKDADGNWSKEDKKSIDMKKEIRCIEPVNAEIRLIKRTRKVEGYGIVFGKESRDLGGFTEIINSEATEGVIEQSDILALLNHDESKGLLARSTNGEGTLDLITDKFGVKYIFEAPDTALGDEVLSGVRRGDIRTSSFSFSVSDGQKWEKRKDGTYLRTIIKFDKIYDVSPVYREAYADTTVAVRNLDDLKEKETINESIIMETNIDPGQEKRQVMDITKMRKETLKDGTVIAYEDWLSKGTQVFVEKDGSFDFAPDGKMILREREEIYTSNMEMTIKDGFVTEIKSTSTSVSRKEPDKDYYEQLRNKIPKK